MKIKFPISLKSLLFVLIFASTPIHAEKELSLGWEPWEPYQYKDKNDQVTGLDVKLVSAALKNAGYAVKLLKRPWNRHLKELEQGNIDLAAAASKNSEREAYAYFTEAYRTEDQALIIRKGEKEKFNIKKLSDITNSSFRLGVLRGSYYGEDYKKLLKDPEFKKHVSEMASDKNNHQKLLANRIDGFIADPVAAAAALREQGISDQVEILLTVNSDDVFIMFSKKSTTMEDVEAFNKSLATLKADGSHEQILNDYLK